MPPRWFWRCHYALDDLAFEEIVSFETPDGPVDVGHPDAQAAFRLVHLLAGVSYYKAAAPPRIVVGQPGLTPAERRLLEAVYLDGLGEYAYRNRFDLSAVTIDAPDRPPVAPPAANPAGTGRQTGTSSRPLVPFGGGLDSIVTVEGIRDRAPESALFIVSRHGDRFDAIETAAGTTQLPVCRAERQLDPKILRSSELGFRNGHIPVTGIISSIAVAAAVLNRRDAVIMSNEWSASSGNVEWGGRVINHQWSKTLEFEDLFRSTLTETMETAPDYYSWLRPFSELWVAKRFTALERYHLRFRSCNRAFHIDRSLRLDHWCGHCDKCCFIDLILSPFLPRARLDEVFRGAEPLANPDMTSKLRTLVGLSGEIKPFECVGDIDECRVAVLLAARRTDRAAGELLQGLAHEVGQVVPGDVDTFAQRLLHPLGEHRIPDAHAPDDLLV